MIRVQNLVKTFGTFNAVNDVSHFTFETTGTEAGFRSQRPREGSKPEGRDSAPPHRVIKNAEARGEA